MSFSASWRPSPQALTYALSVTAASVPATSPIGFTAGGGTVRIVNTGTTNVQIVFGVGPQTAALPVTGAPPVGQFGVMVKAGSVTYFDIQASADSFAAIGDGAGPSTIYVQRGEGTGP